MEDFDPAIAVAIALAVEEETDVPKRKRAKWSKEWFLQRSTFGHTKLLRELSHNEPSDLKNFLRMDAESYNELLQMVEPLIEKQTTNMRQPISPGWHLREFGTLIGRQMILLHNLIDGHHRRSINCAMK